MALGNQDSVREASARASAALPKNVAATKALGRIKTVPTPRPVTRVAPRAAVPVRAVVRPKSTSIFDNLASPSASPSAQAVRRARPAPQISGIVPSQLLNAPNTGAGNWFTGLVTNAGSDALNTFTSIPAQAQLVGMNALTFGLGGPVQLAANVGLNQALGRVPGFGFFNTLTKNTIAADKAAGKATAQDYNTRWVQPAIALAHGNWRPLRHQLYQHPLYGALDILGAKAALGHAPNVIPRAVMRFAPESEAAARASRRLSTLPGDARKVVNDAQNARRAAARAYAGITENVPRKLRAVPFEPGHGNLYRPPRKVFSHITNPEDGFTPVGSRTRDVPRAPYSGDFIKRARQRATDSLRAKYAPKIEERANRAQQVTPGTPVSPFQGLKRVAYKPLTTEAKYRRFVKADTRGMVDMFNSAAEADLARKLGDSGLARAYHALKPDTNAAGIRINRHISTEQMATTLHWEDVLSPRAGMTPQQLRDLYVENVQKNIDAKRAAGRPTAHMQANVDVIKAIPDKLLELTDTKDPAVARVKALVEAGRRADALNQAQAVRTPENPRGYINPETAQAIRSRPSAINLGGSQWWEDAVGGVKREYAPQLKTLREQRDAAISSGETARAAKINDRIRQLGAEQRTRIATIKESASSHPAMEQARAEYHDAVAKLEAERTKVRSGASAPTKLEVARRNRDTYAKRLAKMEKEHLGLTPPTRPELVSDRAVYLPRRSTRPRNPDARGSGAIGMQDVNRSKGHLENSAEWDMHPKLMLEQTRRASENYSGKRSPQATHELIQTIAYKDANGQNLTGASRELQGKVDLSRVAFINKAKLDTALKHLDELPQGQWLDKKTADEVFADHVPPGARKADYVAVHRDAVDVWKEQMRSQTAWRHWDDLTTYWKGGLLSLSPRWYINNTLGLSLQYGLLAGGDVRSIVLGANPEVRAAMERAAPHIARDTLGHEAMGSTEFKVLKFMQKGFDINSHLEEIWRRAAFANRTKRILSNENIRGLNARDFAHAIDHLPPEAIRQIARDVDYFIGDYRKFNATERNVIKRVIPFYSWLRVISRITFGLPFRSPLRAELVAVLGKAAVAGIDPTQYQRPVYDRSAMVFGNTRIGMNSANPASTVTGFVNALGAQDKVQALLAEGQAFLHPLAGAVLAKRYGTNLFGNLVSPAPGTASYGQDPHYVNRVSGVVDSQPAGMPFSEIALQTVFPGQINIIRKIAAGGLTPRDTTTTMQLIQDATSGKSRDMSLYYKPKTGAQASTPFWFTPVLNALTGANVNKQDTTALLVKAHQDLLKFQAQQRALAAQKKRASGG